MYGIRAYTEGGKYNGYVPGMLKSAKQEGEGFTEVIKNSGDSVCFSNQALELTASGKNGVSNCPQDATYDQYGNISRQFYAIQKDLAELTAATRPYNFSVANQLNSINSHINCLQMQV